MKKDDFLSVLFNRKSKTKSPFQMERNQSFGTNLGFAASEAYKLLRTNVIFSMAYENKCKIVGVTSTLQAEGKSTTSINLTYSLAESGKRVLLIEGDMRLPVLATTLNLKDNIGLSNVLVGVNSLNEAVHQSTPIRNMSVLPAGEVPPNPSEMLSSKRMEQIIETLTDSFEFIIVDLPPISIVSDGLAIAHLLSGMIVVCRQDYCNRQLLAETMRRMELLRIKVLGFVFTGVKTVEKKYSSYGKRNSHGYGYSYANSRAKDGEVRIQRETPTGSDKADKAKEE